MRLRNFLCSAAAALAGLAAPFAASADAITRTNPVTGETVTFGYEYVGEGGWDVQDWQDAAGANPPDVPQAKDSNVWDSLLIDGINNDDLGVYVSSPEEGDIEGWNFGIGLYNNALLDVLSMRYWNGESGVPLFAIVDETSYLTIQSIDSSAYWNSPVDYYVAAPGGISYGCSFSPSVSSSAKFNYYLKGDGTVEYPYGITSGGHVIRQADVTLSGGEKAVKSKPLVEFGDEGTYSVKFSAAAKIIRNDEAGAKIDEINLVSSTFPDATSLTADGAAGSCELVQNSSGVWLYWVDGDPTEVVPAAEGHYKPSININFTHNGNGVTTSEDVGLSEYAVPGNSWDNMAAANGTMSAVSAVNSNGVASILRGVSVTVSGTRGSYTCSSLASASELRHGYIDEEDNNSTPTITVTGIPYSKYRVVVYHATDTADASFGYDTINGTDYTYVNGALTEGSTAWGAAGAANSANAIAVGENTLVTGELSGPTLSVIGHRMSSANRGCIAAIQIVEVKPTVGANDLLIELSGDTTYPVVANATYGTVYVTGSGTLTFSGAGTITATTLDVSSNATVNMSGIAPTTVVGSGTVVYDGTLPNKNLGWTDAANWRGTVWLRNSAVVAFESNSYGNANSALRLTGVSGYLQRSTTNAPYEHRKIELVDDGDVVAFTYNNGWGGGVVNISALAGTGTMKAQGAGNGEIIYVADPSGFEGSFDFSIKKLVLGGEAPSGDNKNWNGAIIVSTDATATISTGKRWNANAGFVVDGTLNNYGTLASAKTSGAITGSGTVVFGDIPSPTGDAWWKNSAWTGTVEIKDATITSAIRLSDYGNAGSSVCMNGTTAYLDAMQEDSAGSIKELVIGSNGFTNDGRYTSEEVVCVVPYKITGTGAYRLAGTGVAKKTVRLTGDLSAFGGFFVPAERDSYKSIINNRFVVGETSRDFVDSSIVVGEGNTLTVAKNGTYPGGMFIDKDGRVEIIKGDGFVWTAAGITVDGELSVDNLKDAIGGGTSVTLSDTGVLEITRSDGISADDGATDYSRVKGTGTLRYAGTGFVVISNKFPTNLTLEAEKGNGVVVPVAGAIVGSVTGTKGFRSDWGNTSEAGRYLTIKQSKDTIWQGSINQTSGHRLTGVIVDPGESATGTLTMTATQTASSTLTVNGSVNLTGTWVGATTVAGSFGGTGTLTGDLTFSEGSVFKVFNTSETGLRVSGAIAYPAEGTVTVEVGEGAELGSQRVILNPTGDGVEIDLAKFALAENTPEGYSLSKSDDGKLVLTTPSAAAQIGETQYATLEAALTALAGMSGAQTLTALVECEAETITVQSGLNLTLAGSLSVHSVTVEKGASLVVTDSGVAVRLFSVAGTLTLNAAAAGTSVYLTDADATCTVKAAADANVSVTSGVEGMNAVKSEDVDPVWTLEAPPTRVSVQAYGCSFTVDNDTAASIASQFGVAQTDATKFGKAAFAYAIGAALDENGEVVVPSPTISVAGSAVTVTVSCNGAKVGDYSITCTLQYAAALSATMQWTNVAGNGGSVTMTSDVATLGETCSEPRRFYRVAFSVADKQAQ